MTMTPEQTAALKEVIMRTANEIYGLTADNGKMSIQESVARDQFIKSEKKLVYGQMEALRATIEAILESSEF